MFAPTMVYLESEVERIRDEDKLSGEDAGVQIATLVSALPDRAIEALDTLPYENQSDKKDVKKILELLEAEYLDDVNEIYESYIFFTRQQEEGEPIA